MTNKIEDEVFRRAVEVRLDHLAERRPNGLLLVGDGAVEVGFADLAAGNMTLISENAQIGSQGRILIGSGKCLWTSAGLSSPCSQRICMTASSPGVNGDIAPRSFQCADDTAYLARVKGQHRQFLT